MLAARCARDSPTCWWVDFTRVRARGDQNVARLGNGRRQQSGLVEAPRPVPPPVLRHRDKRVGIRQKLAAGPCEPASHHRREIKPVAILERVHQRARNLVEKYGSAGALVSRWIGDRLHGEDAATGIVGERNTQPLAIGARHEGELRPAGRAKAFALDRLAQTALNRGEIERSAKDRAGAGVRKPRKCCDDRSLPHMGTLPGRAGVVIRQCRVQILPRSAGCGAAMQRSSGAWATFEKVPVLQRITSCRVAPRDGLLRT